MSGFAETRISISQRRREAVAAGGVGVLAAIASTFILSWVQAQNPSEMRAWWMLAIGIAAAILCILLILWISRPVGEAWTLRHAYTFIGTGWARDNKYYERREAHYKNFAELVPFSGVRASMNMLALMHDAKNLGNLRTNIASARTKKFLTRAVTAR